MDYLQQAKDSFDQSQGDIRYSGQKEHLLSQATICAAIAQAEALTRIAAVMEAGRADVEREAYRQELHAALDDDPVFD